MARKYLSNSLIAVAFAAFCFHSITAAAVETGRWEGKAEFGTFEFTVGSNGSQFESITYHFTDLNCNSVEISGDYLTVFDPPWRITGESFGFTIELEPDVTIQLKGTFVKSRTGTGTWRVVVDGVRCDGTWNAFYDTSSRSVDHAFVKGVYWSPEELPGWGFFADVQEDLFFAAVFGYLDQDSSFITLQGSLISSFPMRFRGDVFFQTEGGTMSSDVGDFTWVVGDSEAVPLATLTLTSNILDATDLKLIRFSFAEDDRVDMITGGDWNIIRRPADSTFADHYTINDSRIVEDGNTYASVINRGDEGKQGRVGYFSDAEGDFYGMRVEYGATTEVFYLFLATNADMYGRYWIVETGEQPSGNGDYFRAAADNMQKADLNSSADTGMLQSLPVPGSGPIDSGRMEMQALEMQQHKDSGGQLEPMFDDSRVQYAFGKLSRTISTSSKPME